MKLTHLISTLLAISSVVTLNACSQQDEDISTDIIRPVRTHTVGLPNEATWREFPGVIDAAQQADLAFRVNGKLIKLLANEGDFINEGQIIAQLDQTDYKIQLKSRQAEYDRAKADYDRAKGLVKKGVISRADFDKLKASYTTANSNLESAQQNLAYTELKSPFKGRISKRHIDNYEDVAGNQVIYTLQDISSLTVKVDIPESVMIRVRDGAKPKISAHFAEIPETSFPLKIKEVSTQADPDTKTFRITFEMARIGKHNILPGMSVTVRGQSNIKDTITDQHIIVPAHAVLEDRQGRYVYIAVVDKEAIAVVQRKDVTTGQLSSSGLQIISGLKQGDNVITAGMSKMRAGIKVRLMTGDKP